ncbi:MAG TPA: dTMP kinase [Methylomirabilota bacterium]|nr:dTMP kinase [Methylomirabilota bacterium]
MSDTRGWFITFEGGEGAGKSTQVRRLALALARGEREIVTTREPGGSPTAEVIRAFLLSGRARPLGTVGEAYLFAAARIDHIAETIRPAVNRGAVVLCDRFADSTRVYQGTAGGLDKAVVDHLERVAVGDMAPDLTVVLDVPASVGLQRAMARSAGLDRFEGDPMTVHDMRRRGFLEIARANPERCVVIDATADPDEVAAVIRTVVAERLGLAMDPPGEVA